MLITKLPISFRAIWSKLALLDWTRHNTLLGSHPGLDLFAEGLKLGHVRRLGVPSNAEALCFVGLGDLTFTMVSFSPVYGIWIRINSSYHMEMNLDT